MKTFKQKNTRIKSMYAGNIRDIKPDQNATEGASIKRKSTAIIIGEAMLRLNCSIDAIARRKINRKVKGRRSGDWLKTKLTAK